MRISDWSSDVCSSDLSEKQDRTFCPPQRREFDRALEHGRRRIEQRIAAYDLRGEQMLRGFFRAMAFGAQAISDGHPESAFHMNPTAGPSPIRAEVIKASTPGQIGRAHV